MSKEYLSILCVCMCLFHDCRFHFFGWNYSKIFGFFIDWISFLLLCFKISPKWLSPPLPVLGMVFTACPISSLGTITISSRSLDIFPISLLKSSLTLFLIFWSPWISELPPTIHCSKSFFHIMVMVYEDFPTQSRPQTAEEHKLDLTYLCAVFQANPWNILGFHPPELNKKLHFCLFLTISIPWIAPASSFHCLNPKYVSICFPQHMYLRGAT